ncbi:tetratricopeptide repeat protein [Thermodesulfovibrio yellowstonii]|uniref:Tetratricopeptide repeat domain protein n=1 Tax=Thermodesulfovibrio yellowstonii TaxID=28262 RepID=A0A9W6GF76_9BACT|nr:tetratricopeptide repeat protein [Thermodesulfovibrio islandicus]GLI52890.1 tetratricopeptide repeat domain protein [Thermodesulfovibrio islandicus]
MKFIRWLLFIPFIIALIGCEPIRITTKVAPFEVEPPKEVLSVKKLPNEAIVLIDDTQVYSATKYTADVIHTVEFPAGNLLRQVLPIYFDKMFSKTKYEKNLSSLIPSNGLLIHAIVDNINFSEECCYRLEVNSRTKFEIYDNDLIEMALPVFSSGSGKLSKSGLFSTINEKEYGITAYQAIFNSVKNATEAIYEVVSNPKAQISEAKQLINKDPSNMHAYRVVANLSLKNNDIPEALAASQMHVQLAPKDPNGYLLLHKCYLAQRKYKEALVQLEQAVSLAPKSAILLMKLHDFYIERGKYEKAIEAVKRYIEQRPDDQYAPLRLSLLYFKIGKYDEVIKISEKVINNFSFSGIGASIIKNEGEYTKIKSIEPNSPAQKAGLKPNYEIIEIDGKSTLEMKLNEVVQSLRGQEGTEVKLKIRKPDSDESFTVVLNREKFYTNPVVASYMSLIAISSIEFNDKINAQKYIDEAEKISPQDDYLKLAKSALYLKEMQYEKSLTEAISVKDSDYAQLLQSIAYAKLGKYEESLNLYKKLIKSKSLLITNRKKEELFSALSPYLEKIENKAIEYERTGQYVKALTEYARLLEISPPDKAQWIRIRVAKIISQNPSLVELKDESRKHFLHAEVLFTKEKFEEAIDELDKSSLLQPFNPQIYFNKAIIYEKISDFAKAIENMEIYLQLNPSAPNAQTIKDQIYKWRFMLEKEL